VPCVLFVTLEIGLSAPRVPPKSYNNRQIRISLCTTSEADVSSSAFECVCETPSWGLVPVVQLSWFRV